MTKPQGQTGGFFLGSWRGPWYGTVQHFLHLRLRNPVSMCRRLGQPHQRFMVALLGMGLCCGGTQPVHGIAIPLFCGQMQPVQGRSVTWGGGGLPAAVAA